MKTFEVSFTTQWSPNFQIYYKKEVILTYTEGLVHHTLLSIRPHTDLHFSHFSLIYLIQMQFECEGVYTSASPVCWWPNKLMQPANMWASSVSQSSNLNFQKFAGFCLLAIISIIVHHLIDMKDHELPSDNRRKYFQYRYNTDTFYKSLMCEEKWD